MAEKHRVRSWRGRRNSYEFLKSVNRLDAWTKYVVVEEDGSLTEYYGLNRVNNATGQLLPVKSVVSAAPDTSLASPYDRYLVGEDGVGYRVVEYLPKDTTDGVVLVKEELTFDEKYGVRVIDRGLKNYIYLNGALRTYDDVDCGLF